MKASCWICKHYCQKSHIITKGLNVSGKPAKYRVWSKHRCALKQEDIYPEKCDFEKNMKLWEELEERYPDLAVAHRRADSLWKELTVKYPDLAKRIHFK